MLMYVRDYLVCKIARKFSQREVFDEICGGIGLLQFKKSVMLFFVNSAFQGSSQIIMRGCNVVLSLTESSRNESN